MCHIWAEAEGRFCPPHNNTGVTEVTVFMGEWKCSNICFKATGSYTLAQEARVFMHVEPLFLVCGNPFCITRRIVRTTCALPVWWLLTNTSPHGCSDPNIYRTLITDTGNGKTANPRSLPCQAPLSKHLGEDFGSNERGVWARNPK